MALEVAEYAYLLETGTVILEGPSSELKRDEKVIKAYLGARRRWLRRINLNRLAQSESSHSLPESL